MISIKENIPVALYTVFKIGGPAKYFCEVKNKEELIEALDFARSKKAPFFMLGAGSNILVADSGFPGLMIKIGLRELIVAPTHRDQGRSGENRIFAGAGVSIAKAVNFAVENGFGGFEWGIGIPGTIGGSVFGNSGCYGSEMKDVVGSVDYLEIQKSQENLVKANMQKNIRVLQNVAPSEACDFSYRDSTFKKHPEWIILGATLNLKRGNQAESRKKIIEYTKRRAQTQDIGEKCAGCIFKNPKPDLAAAYLIDKAGLKGKVVGNAMVSQKHANYIVNTGGATSADVKNLIEFIKSEVKKVHGITLENEIRFV